MDYQQLRERIQNSFPNISIWEPEKGRWKDRTILLGFQAKINAECYYIFLGQDGLGRQIKYEETNIPIYCEIALVKGGDITEKLGTLGEVIFRLLPEYKRKRSYYRFASFLEKELDAAGQKLIDILSLVLPTPVL